MKINNIFYGIPALAAALVLSACSSDYLQVNPETNVGSEDITATVDNAKLAINGICNSMQTQYQSTDINQYNGETYINTVFNDAFGNDYVAGLAVASFGADSFKMQTWGNANYYVCEMPWNYAYNLIAQANQILVGIDGAEGSEAERDFVKAQALTFRAFGFVKLLQLYAPRWEDSNNGSDYCIVLRLEPGVGPVPLSTMAETLDQVYKDLDEAIALYEGGAKGVDRDYKWQPNLSVAQGVYARAAMIKHDWAKAQKMAHDARSSYKLMDNDTYLSGFVDDNDDFMWAQAAEESDIYYWSYGSHYAVNGIYVKNWNLGAGAISQELVRQLDPNDIRLRCFITPDKIDVLKANGLLRGNVKPEFFWDNELVDLNNNLSLAFGGTSILNQSSKKRYGLYNLALNYIVYYFENYYKGNPSYVYSDFGEDQGVFYPYFSLVSGSKGAQILNHTDSQGKNVRGELVCTPFGAQLKFCSIPPYGCSHFPFMRASEMVLTEAEAAYMAGDISTARSCLQELNGMRIPGFQANNYSGDALLNQIRLSRRIELWGEGQSFSDLKRWNLPLVRTAWKQDNVDSGNWPTAMGCDITNIPSVDNSWWRLNVPNGESEFNSAVDRNLLPW